MTYRDRRRTRAMHLRDHSASNEKKSEAAFGTAKQIADGIPFGQPILVGHHSEGRARRDQKRIVGGMAKGFEHSKLADRQASAADEIDRQADNAIYSDDPDAVERLEAKIAGLERERDRVKAYNALRRKRKTDDALTEDMDAAELTDEERRGLVSTIQVQAYACPHGAFPAYHLQNLSGNINKQKKRLVHLRAEQAEMEAGGRGTGRVMLARFPGGCAECDEQIERGAPIVYYRVTREAVHAKCAGEVTA